MTKSIPELLNYHRHRGVLVDTQLLLLWCVGTFDKARVATFKNTRGYLTEDYELLASFIGQFDRILTTPNVITELSNLAGQLGEPARSNFFSYFSEFVRSECVEERYLETAKVAQDKAAFVRLGVTDVAVKLVTKPEDNLVLTDDFGLFDHLSREGAQVINFSHFRMQGWSWQ